MGRAAYERCDGPGVCACRTARLSGPGPVPRAKKRRSIGGIILLVFGAVIVMASIAGCLAIDLIPGDHGDSGDGLAWAGVALLLYVVPFGLMLMVSGLILVFAARSRSR